MAKKKNSFGKFLAFTTAVAAIGGTCYVFRDKIKACPLYQKSADKLSEIKDCLSDKFCNQDEDDFYFDDFYFDDEDDEDFEDVFAETEQGREYTSITINPKDTASSTDNEEYTSSDSAQLAKTEDAETSMETPEEKEDVTVSKELKTEEKEDVSLSAKAEIEEKEKISPSEKPETEEKEESIPTINFGSSFSSTHLVTEDSSKENAAEAQVTGYENHGLSDVSEDPDVLEEQDKLDF